MNQPFYTGKGIGVAILDTGIYQHIDFDSRICAFVDFISNKKMAYDDNGHGTCVAGILAGSGAASMGKYKGAALYTFLLEYHNIITFQIFVQSVIKHQITRTYRRLHICICHRR